ncbi:hypothetical protein [Mesorhizobium sp. B263B2A]|uniref:hypothetical protein n=1 Tax=Mesorhizobium sp. B263B2A TaxID=2876669 RepID=UPI001CD160F0|nr:hypothetical protein [Mesorhizobium sp. B263B2A]MCA0032753.1 hypothetical protein [Mesorhizobium sp. B263B2A]
MLKALASGRLIQKSFAVFIEECEAVFVEQFVSAPTTPARTDIRRAGDGTWTAHQAATW